jgi:adenine-specific DNA glycosylase
LTDVEEIIRSTGFYSNKARSLVGMAQRLVEAFDSEVPGAMEDLVTIPGVGRKTANVVRSVALGLPGLPVDTHVLRLTRRLGITTETDPVKVEYVLNAMIPPAERGEFSLRLILHGRRTCFARKPNCGACVLADFCPSAGSGEPPPRAVDGQRGARSNASSRRPAEPSARSTSRSRTAKSSRGVPSSRREMSSMRRRISSRVVEIDESSARSLDPTVSMGTVLPGPWPRPAIDARSPHRGRYGEWPCCTGSISVE